MDQLHPCFDNDHYSGFMLFGVAAMWVMKNWKKSMALQQLSLTDTDKNDKRQTYLFRLSEKGGSFAIDSCIIQCKMKCWTTYENRDSNVF